MPDHEWIAARLREASPACPSAGLDELACLVLALNPAGLALRESVLLAEIEELAQAIQNMRQEVASLPVDDIATMHIPSASDELDAIVTHTEVATDTILESCEKLDTLAGTLDTSPSHAVQALTGRIYEACGFQDITGQRIAKIVATLHVIEAKVGRISSAFMRAGTADTEPDAAKDQLLSGPQLPADAMAQAEVDRLLAAF